MPKPPLLPSDIDELSAGTLISLLKNAHSQTNAHHQREFSKSFFPYRLLVLGPTESPFLVTHKALEKARSKQRLTESALDDIEAFTDFLETVGKLDERKIAEKYEFNERRDSLHYYARVMAPAEKRREKEKSARRPRNENVPNAFQAEMGVG